MDGLPDYTKAGTLKIEVIFDIDGNRNLQVTASEGTSGRMLKARISTDWINKVNYHDLPSQYKSSDSSNEPMQEYISVTKASSIAIWAPLEAAAAMEDLS